jgi:hypothetical protein
MTLAQKRQKVAVGMGYSSWDNLIEMCCQNNTPNIIHDAEVKVKENWSPENKIVLNIPDWYKKEEMFYYLRRHEYSREIAERLSQRWADDLQGSFRKGFEKGVQYESGRNVDAVFTGGK